MGQRHSLEIVFALVTLSACSVGGERRDSGRRPEDSGPCADDRLYCNGNTVQRCIEGNRVDSEMCTGEQVCADGIGCAACRPAEYMCSGPDLYRCVDDGSRYEVERTCPPDQLCTAIGPLGQCQSACADAVANRS